MPTFKVEAIDEPQPNEWFLYMQAAGEDGEEAEYEFYRTFESETEAWKFKKLFDGFIEDGLLINLEDWLLLT